MMVMFLGIMFLGSMQPVMMVLSLIFITLLYSVYLYKMMMSFWYGYALIMVMLSGVFVVFTYMASLVPNEEFEIYSLIFLVILMFIFFLEMKELMGEMNLEIICLNLWVSYVSVVVMFLVGMLLSVMVMVVWVSCKNKGALRVM